jgi:hypothetical protein
MTDNNEGAQQTAFNIRPVMLTPGCAVRLVDPVLHKEIVGMVADSGLAYYDLLTPEFLDALGDQPTPFQLDASLEPVELGNSVTWMNALLIESPGTGREFAIACTALDGMRLDPLTLLRAQFFMFENRVFTPEAAVSAARQQNADSREAWEKVKRHLEESGVTTSA